MTIVDRRTAIEHRSVISTVLEALPMELCAWDDELRLRYANAAARANNSVTPVVGGTVHELLGESMLGHVGPYIEAAADGHVQRYEWSSARADGTRSTLVVELAPVVVNGAVVGVRSLGAELVGTEDIRARTHLLIEREHVGERLDSSVQPQLRAAMQALALLPRAGVLPAEVLTQIATDLDNAVAELREVIRDLRDPLPAAPADASIPSVARRTLAVDGAVGDVHGAAPLPRRRERRWGVEHERALFDALPPAEAWRADTGAVVLNAAALHSLGWPADADLAGRSYRTVAGDELADVNEPAVRAALGGLAVSSRLEFREADGTISKGLQRYAPLVQGGGRWAVGVRLDVGTLLDGDGSGVAEFTEELTAERGRIAEDLHDNVIQLLYAAGLAVTTVADDPGADVAEALSGAVQCVAEAMLSLHSAGGMLQRERAAGLHELVSRVARRAVPGLGFTPRVDLVGEPKGLPDEVVDDVVAVLREALSNAARHAQAQRVHVVVSTARHEARVEVRDDGVGIGEPDRASGLANMRARARRHGGSFEARGNAPHGTVIDWRVPL